MATLDSRSTSTPKGRRPGPGRHSARLEFDPRRTPNRLYLWTGTIDPEGKSGGHCAASPNDYLPVFTRKTYPERLQSAGVSWQVYANNEVGDGDFPNDAFVGDFGDNPLWFFQAYHDALASNDPNVHQLAERGGAAYIQGVLQALWANPKLAASTVVFIDYDENDGVVRSSPAAGAAARNPRRDVARDSTRFPRVAPTLRAACADRAGPTRPDDGGVPVEPRRVGELAGLRSHVGASLPGSLDRRARAEHFGLAACRAMR